MPSDYVLELPSELEAVQRAVDFLMQRGEEAGFERDRLRLNFRVGVTEALVNAMVYGNEREAEKSIHVEASFDADCVQVVVRDQGAGFDPGALPDPTQPPHRGEAGGRGVFLIRSLMDSVSFNERGNEIRMTLRRRAAVGADLPDGHRKPEDAAALEGPATDTAVEEPSAEAPEPSTEGNGAGAGVTEEAAVADLPSTLTSEVRSVADDFLRHFPQTVLEVWARGAAGWSHLYGSQDGASSAEPPDEHMVVLVPGGPRLAVSAGGDGAAAAFFARSLELILGYEEEARLAARELAERYEEINLLYSISEILGAVVNLPDAATKILTEVAETLGGRRASIWVHDRERDRLVCAAAVGDEGSPSPIALDDPASVTARVFREREALNVERGGDLGRGGETGGRRLEEAFLSVPITYTPPDADSRTIGVITLVGRRHHERFSAGDARLLAAVASQIGAALETQRLMHDNVRQERFRRELELAHDLQMKLLPSTEELETRLKVAARCAPADSVGGDFYHLVRLSESRSAVVIGDVSSHGFAAALIMALSMSAIGIYARETESPAEVLRHLHRALVSELQTTEMYMALWYGVVDLDTRRITYANAGHPHAFMLRGDGGRERLPATNPPLGLVPLQDYGEAVLEWDPTEDMLVLFTDGLSNAYGEHGSPEGEYEMLDRIHEMRHMSGGDLLAQLFLEASQRPIDTPPDDRTALLVRG